MFQLRETQEELIQHQKVHEELAYRSRKLLKGQADLLCQALQQLKRRSDAGQETAGRIWDSLIDGITAEIPSEFFDDNADTYFWDSAEELSTDEMAFRKLLEQAASKKKHIGDGTDMGGNNNKFATVSVMEGTTLPASASALSVKPVEGGVDEGQEEDNEETDVLLRHLIDMLKVAEKRTELSLWDWKKGDEELKHEVGIFNNSLNVALDLFDQIHNSPNVTSLIEAIEKFSANDAKKVVKVFNEAGSVSIESSYDYSEEEEDIGDEDSEDNEVFNSSATEDEFDQDRKAIGLPMKKSSSSRQKERNFKSSSSFGEPSAPKLDVDGEGYIIRHARSKKAGKPLKSKIYRNPKCDHAGYTIPISHYRDWKRDGFRCMCGQKFRFMNAMDKHIFTHQEARMLACDKCEYKVNRKCCMEKHKKDNHNRPKMLRACRRLYQCMFGCEGVLKSKKELFDHQLITERQCKHINALKLPVRQLPPTPLAFVNTLKRTFENANLDMTVDRLDEILTAAEKDIEHIRKIREQKLKLIASAADSNNSSEF